MKLFKLVYFSIAILLFSTDMLAQPFGPRQSLFNDIDRPSDIEIIDFDADGDMDLFVANSSSFYILFYENVGNMGFVERRINQNLEIIYENIEVADLDNDGKYELIAASLRDKIISLFKFTGKSVIEEVTLDEGIEPASLLVEDIDQDGLEDIIYSVDENEGSMIILWNDGAYNFNSYTAASEIGDNAYLFAADLNNDGNLDLASQSIYSGRMFSILNQGDNTFVKFEAAIETTKIIDACLYDINQDGFIDFIPTYDHQNLIAYSYYLNNENNGFLSRGFSDISPKAACAIDLNFDGSKEIMVSDADGLALSFKYIDGFDFERDTIEGIEDSYNLMEVVDFNGDGIDDIVGVNIGNSVIAVYLQRPDSTFEKTLITTGTHIAKPEGLKSIDIDEDGENEFIGYSEFSRSAIVWEKSSNGILAGKKLFNLPEDGSSFNGFTDIEPYDLDSDGQSDLVAATMVDNESLSWFKKTAENEYSYNPIEVPFHAMTGIDIVDINGDGRVDIPCVSRGEERIGILIDTGNISYEYQSISNGYSRPTDIEAIDIDLDGDDDLICKYGSVGGQMVIFENTGTDFTVKETLSGLILVDIDQDGDMDILAGRNATSITCHYNDGAGNFTSETIASTNSHENDELYTSDIDNDGDIDIVSGDFSLNAQRPIVYILNNGDGTFADAETLESNNSQISQVSEVAAEDFDGDGDKEVIVAALNRGNISWYENLVVNCLAQGSSRMIDACDRYVLEDGTVINESEIFIDTLYNSFGCDSIVTFDVQIVNIDSTIILNENILEVMDVSSTSFQWVNCDNNFSPIQGETNATFEADSSGNYAVILTKDGCVDTSECVFVQTTNTRDVNRLSAIQTFPNPVKDVLSIRELPIGGTLMIQDVSGRVLSTFEITASNVELPMASYQSGIYFMKVIHQGSSKVISFVKE
jgi:hypothetical protein